MKVGNNKSFDVVFPEDYHDKGIAEKTVIFEVKLNALEEQVLPNLDVDVDADVDVAGREEAESLEAVPDEHASGSEEGEVDEA